MLQREREHRDKTFFAKESDAELEESTETVRSMCRGVRQSLHIWIAFIVDSSHFSVAMCRFVVYVGHKNMQLADVVTRPEHSIIRQSFDSRERREATFLPGRLNADGFGIGWYIWDNDDVNEYRFCIDLLDS